jgi:serine/threonine protein kinase/WD40 repeat protein
MIEEELFHRALEKPTLAEQLAFLDQVCANQPELRERIERLLRSHRHEDSFLQPEVTTDEPAAERPGTVIGPYKLIEQVGEGGMGTVWMAQQTEPVKRLVAMKVIKPGMDSKQVIARFEAERQALALMDHANIARVLDGGTTSAGRPYFVMDLVKGMPITRYCDEHHLTPRQRLELFIPVCQAVQHAHQKGIIHRDLKPSNVLVALYDGKPVPKVIDFGVAKATGVQLTDATLVTGFGNIVGTLEYMSPEQAEINQLDIDTRSDIYSLGVLLYELLTGSPPFSRKELEKAGMLEMLRVIREQEPSKPSTKLSTAEGLPTLAANRGTEPAKLTKLVRGELDWIVMKTLDKDRNRRYETANGFALDVQRYLAGEPVLAVPPSAWYRFRKFARRNRELVLATSLVLLALLVGIAGTTWGMVRAIRAEADAVSEAGQKQTALTAAQASERDARDSLWVSLNEQARARRFSRRMGQRTASLDALVKAAAIRPDERLRDEAIAALALPDVGLGPTWHAWPPGHEGWAFDAEYRLYARVSDKGVISVRTVADDREVQHIDCGSTRFAFLILSPDGRYLTAADAGTHKLCVWRVADRKAMLRYEFPRIWGLAFSPDSRHVAVGQQGWVIRFELATGEEVNRWKLPETMWAHHLAFHPDNCRLAVGYRSSGVVSVYDATNGKPVAHLPLGSAQFEQVVAWHPDGDRLAVGGGPDPRIQIWNVAAKRKVATLVGHAQNVTSLSFHPDGELMTSCSHDGTLRLWDLSTGRQLMRLISPLYSQFSRDGRWLGVAQRGEHAQLLEVTPPREYRSLSAGDGGSMYDHDISPDGQLLAMNLGTACRLFHLPTGRELAALPHGRPLFNSNTELLVVGPGGLHRWPIHPGAAVGELRLGPPRTVALPAAPTRAERSHDGRTLAVVSEAEGIGTVMDLATDSVKAPSLWHGRAGYVALSGNARWVATGGWHSDRIRLWNAETGKMVHEWRQFRAMAFFTPDSRALIVSDDAEFSFWDVETLQPVRRIRRDVSYYPGHVCFSPDGKLMALEVAPGVIHLRDAATDRVVARLEDPHGDHAWWMRFTPDGTQLVVSAPYARAVHVWDLRAIRRRLKGVGLDWDWPEFPPAATADEPGRRFAEPAWKVQVVQPAGGQKPLPP